MGKIPLRFAVTKPRTSRYRPRTRVWGCFLLHQAATDVQQDELDALEALCCLSAGISSGHQPASRSTSPCKTKQPAKAALTAANRHKRRQQSAAKHIARQSPASEASSGATQVELHNLGLQDALGLPLPVEDIHPAALPPPIFARLQEFTDKQHCAESSDTQHVLSNLTTLQSGSGDTGAQSQQQQSMGRQLAGDRPTEDHHLQQQQQAHHLKLPLQQGPAAGVSSQQPQQQQNQQQQQHNPDTAAVPTDDNNQMASDCAAAGISSAPLPLEPCNQALQQQQAWCPPVNRCFWHVYIARKIQEHQQTRPTPGGNPQKLSMDSPRVHQQHTHPKDSLQPHAHSARTARPGPSPPRSKRAKQQQPQQDQQVAVTVAAAPPQATAAAHESASPQGTATAGGSECFVNPLQLVHAASRLPAGAAALQMAAPQPALPGPQHHLGTHGVGMLPAILAAAAACDTRALHALGAAHRPAAAGVLPCMAMGGPQHIHLPGGAGDLARYGTFAPAVRQPPCVTVQATGAHAPVGPHLLAQLLAGDAFKCLAPPSVAVSGRALAPAWPYAHALGALVGAPLSFPGRVAV